MRNYDRNIKDKRLIHAVITQNGRITNV